MISVLDCTLRDGGYVNHWEFEKQQVKETITGLNLAGIDFIECGFLDSTNPNSRWTTRFLDFNKIHFFLKNYCLHHHKQKLVVMIDHGKYNVTNLPNCDSSNIGGIRVSFHKDDRQKVLQDLKVLANKNYKVFVQPTITTSYTDHELREFLLQVAEINPYAVYIVDTLGNLFRDTLEHVFYIFNEVLPKNIMIGLHLHNNLQLSYANAIDFIRIAKEVKRSVIVDTSLYGMGRGAGNLNTEILIDHLSKYCNKTYNIDQVLMLIDRYYHTMYQHYNWGYSIFYFLSASYGVHPNYALFLLKIKYLSINDVKIILKSIPKKYSNEFNEELIQNLYHDYFHKK